MSNDPREFGDQKLRSALLLLGRNLVFRQRLIDLLKQAEQHIEYSGSVRDDIVGPIVDALHSDSDIYKKTLSDGALFEFFYRTKIARDFLLSSVERPTHVWEPQTTRLLKYLAGITAFDVVVGGAYFGDHAILMARQLHGSGRSVHCFEPNSDQAGMLRRNVALNGVTNLRVQEDALWDEGGVLLRLDGFDSFANVVYAEDSLCSFSTVTIDEYCVAQGCHLGLIMLDIEGAELNALRGASQVVRRDLPFVVFEVHREYVDWSNGLIQTPVCALLKDLGYQLFAIRDFHGNHETNKIPIELIPAARVYLDGPVHGFNMFAVKNVDDLDPELFRFVEDVSPKLLLHKDPSLHHPFDWN